MPEPSLRVQVFDHWDSLASWKERWNQCVDLNPAMTLFQRFEWLEAWWRVFHAGRRLHVLGVFEKDQFIGAAPWFRQDIFLGVARIHWLRFLADEASDYCQIITAPGREPVVIRALLDALKADPGSWNGLWLRELPTAAADGLRSLAESLHWPCRRKTSSTTLSIPLQGSWEDYLNRLSKRMRQNLRRFDDRLQGVEFRVVSGEALTPELLDEILELNRHSPAARRENSFLLHPGYRAMHLDLLAREPFRSSSAFALVTLGGRLACYNYLLRHQGVLMTYQGNYDEMFRHLSVGLYLDMRTIRHAFEQGYAEIDFLRGDYLFKQRYQADTAENQEIRIFRNAVSAWMPGGLLSLYTTVKRVYSRWGVPVKKMLLALPGWTSRLVRALRQRGLAGVLGPVASRWGNAWWHHSQTLLISVTPSELATYDSLPLRSNHWICRELTLADIRLFETRYSPALMAQVIKRLWVQDRCWGVLDGDRLVGYAWFTPREVSEEESDIHWTLNNGELYLYDAMIEPAYRGKGLAILLLNHMFRDPMIPRLTRLLALVDVGNHTMLKSMARFRFKIDALIDRRRIGVLVNQERWRTVASGHSWPLEARAADQAFRPRSPAATSPGK